jgi:hypothetical protein
LILPTQAFNVVKIFKYNKEEYFYTIGGHCITD